MYEEIENVLNKFRRKDNDFDEDSYESTLYIQDTEDETTDIEYDFEEEIEKAFKKIGITQYDFCYIGGFDSPGYDLICKCISYIDLEGRLQTIPVKFEII